MKVCRLVSLSVIIVILLTCSAYAGSLKGTWRSSTWSHQSHTFQADGSIIFDEGNKSNSGSKGKYRRNGQELEWQVKWKTGSYTNWTGVIQNNNTMKVRYYNAWNKGTGNDVLVLE